jgi:hypothetical protein
MACESLNFEEERNESNRVLTKCFVVYMDVRGKLRRGAYGGEGGIA